MFDHIGIGVGDVAATKKFFLDSLSHLGMTVVMDGSDAVGWGPPHRPEARARIA